MELREDITSEFSEAAVISSWMTLICCCCRTIWVHYTLFTGLFLLTRTEKHIFIQKLSECLSYALWLGIISKEIKIDICTHSKLEKTRRRWFAVGIDFLLLKHWHREMHMQAHTDTLVYRLKKIKITHTHTWTLLHIDTHTSRHT